MAAPTHYVDWQVLTTGGYENADLSFLASLAAPVHRPLTLDIGANIGHHSFIFATLGWRVMAFEPNPTLWPFIEAKISSANLSNLRLHRVGLGDKDEVLGFRVPDKSNSGTGHFIVQEAEQGLSELQLPIRHGDNYLAAQGVAKVDVVKIDIQGFERRALRGLRATIARSRPVVCVEIGDENRDDIPSLEALAALLPKDYSFRYVGDESKFMLHRSKVKELSAVQFSEFDGNVFCIPKERLALICS